MLTSIVFFLPIKWRNRGGKNDGCEAEEFVVGDLNHGEEGGEAVGDAEQQAGQ